MVSGKDKSEPTVGDDSTMIDSGSPSASLSLASGWKTSQTSSGTLDVSSTATGTSLSGAMVTSTVATANARPSEMP